MKIRKVGAELSNWKDGRTYWHREANSRFSQFCETHQKKIYLPSLRMKVPDHVYVLGHSYICYKYSCYAYRLYFINVWHVYECNTMRVYHDTIITWATADSFCSLFPYPPQPALPHMWLRNAYDVQWLRCDVTKSGVHLAIFQGHTKKASGKTYTCQLCSFSVRKIMWST
jgi:hypothetical protein